MRQIYSYKLCSNSSITCTLTPWLGGLGISGINMDICVFREHISSAGGQVSVVPSLSVSVGLSPEQLCISSPTNA